MPAPLPLEGIRVLSLNHFIMGPMGVQHLADLGAEVIMVEPLEGGFHRHWAGADRKIGGESVTFLAANRNKRSLAVDLKKPAGLKIVRALAARADVLCENFRPGVLDRLGLGYTELRAADPRLIYASATGFGSSGPYRDRPGQDLLVQAMSGLAAVTGNTTDPARAVGVSAVDHHGAALLAMGIMAALVERARTGKGRLVEVDLLSAALDLQAESLTAYMNGPRPVPLAAPAPIAGWMFPGPYGIYATLDGHVAISLGPIAKLAAALDEPRLEALGDASSYPERARIAELVAAATGRHKTAALLVALEAQQVWHQEVLDYEAVLAHPQVVHNRAILSTTLTTGEPVAMVRHPVRYDGETMPVRLAPQPLGAQSRAVLEEVDYAPSTIDELLRDKVIAAPT